MADDWGQRVSGRCPACGSSALFVAVGGHITCGYIPCRRPTAVADFLLGEIDTLTRHAPDIFTATYEPAPDGGDASDTTTVDDRPFDAPNLLRHAAGRLHGFPDISKDLLDAADEIERLRAEVERLRGMSRELLPRRPSDLKALDDEQENDR